MSGHQFRTNYFLCHLSADVPKLLLEYVEITEGEILDVGCTVPIDYGEGVCRLFRGDSDYPFATVRAQSYSCNFHVGSSQLLGHRPVGSKISIRCDYKIQDFISQSSDSSYIIVWGENIINTLIKGVKNVH